MSKRQKELFPELPSTKKYVSDYPELASEWYPTKNGGLIPEDVLHGSNKKVWWICSEGHEYQSLVFNRALHGKGCAYCAGKKVSEENNLAVLFPEVAKLWSSKNTIGANRVTAKSGKKYWWKCEKGHEWQANPDKLVRKKFPCPYCIYENRGDGLRRATNDYNLQTEYPNVAKHWHEKNRYPASFYMPKSNDKIWWRCDHGHEWQATIDRRTKGNGCPYCSGRKATPDNNLAVKHPELMSEWHPTKNKLTPYE